MVDNDISWDRSMMVNDYIFFTGDQNQPFYFVATRRYPWRLLDGPLRGALARECGAADFTMEAQHHSGGASGEAALSWACSSSSK